ncbi:MAG TPA: type IV pilus modification protein PilV [Candidatus Obscuribacterales bacterium]
MPSFVPQSSRSLPVLRRGEAGFSLLEVLISIVIILLGLLGLAGLVVRSQQVEMEAYQRVQAVALVQDMVDRINANRKAATCYSNGTTGITLGTGAGAPPACGTGTAEERARADADLAAWNNLLLGTAEKLSGTDVGAMIGAQGCITYDNTTEIPGAAGTGVYTVTVVWQGFVATAESPNPCGLNDFGDNSLRRVATATLRIARLGV